MKLVGRLAWSLVGDRVVNEGYRKESDMFLEDLEDKLHDILLGVDDAAAAVLFEDTLDLTVSSRCGMALLDGEGGVECSVLKALGEWLNDLEKWHCYAAIVGDYGRAVAVVDRLKPYMAMLNADGSLNGKAKGGEKVETANSVAK